jgi:hypothetical protein
MKNSLIELYGWFRTPFIIMSHPILLFIAFMLMLLINDAEFNIFYEMVNGASRWIWQYNDAWIRKSGPFFMFTHILIFMLPLIVFHVFERSTGIRKYYNNLVKE